MMYQQDNIHIDYELITKIYHVKIAMLVNKYTSPGSAILDIGCGAGNMLVELQKIRPDLILDIADAYQSGLDITGQRVAIRNSYLVLEQEFDLSPIEARDYDTCVMSHVLEHVPTPLKAINDALDLLKPDGKLVLAVPNPVNPVNFLLVGLRKYRANPGHCFHWDQGHWQNFLENIAKVRVLEYGHDEAFLFSRMTPLTSPLKRIEVFFGNLFPGWTFSHLAVVARPQE